MLVDRIRDIAFNNKHSQNKSEYGDCDYMRPSPAAGPLDRVSCTILPVPVNDVRSRNLALAGQRGLKERCYWVAATWTKKCRMHRRLK